MIAGVVSALLGVLPGVAGAAAPGGLTRISVDPYVHGPGQHRSEVEPDTVGWGRTVVSVFQVGRYPNGGAVNIGWATSTDAGRTWLHGFLPGVTVVAGGPFGRATDPSVAYDARHHLWLTSYLVAGSTSPTGVPARWDLLASRSRDGVHWGRPVLVALTAPGQDLDKNWTVCDDTATSPHYGRCYTEFDAFGQGELIYMTRSSDGGRTWSSPVTTAGAGARLRRSTGGAARR